MGASNANEVHQNWPFSTNTYLISKMLPDRHIVSMKGE